MKNLLSYFDYLSLSNYEFTVEDISNLIANNLSSNNIMDEWLNISEEELCIILEDIDNEDEIEITDIIIDFPSDTENDIEILEPYDRKDNGIEEANAIKNVFNSGKNAGTKTREAMGKVPKKG